MKREMLSVPSISVVGGWSLWFLVMIDGSIDLLMDGHHHKNTGRQLLLATSTPRQGTIARR
jgi:hypothetical protein